MKLYLSSDGFGNHLDRLQALVGTNKSVLFIDNAKDFLSSVDRAAHVEEKQAQFTEAGFNFKELDLRNYFETSDGLEDELRLAGLVWGSGGNTFILRRAMQYSGFDTLLVKHLNDSDLVYGGSSAGAIVATLSLHGTERGDDPYDVPPEYHKTIQWDGLNLTEQFIVPHVGSPWFEQESRDMEDYMKEHQLDYIALRDGEVYLVDGTKTEHLV